MALTPATVVVPVRGAPDELREQLRALAAQVDADDLEVIVGAHGDLRGVSAIAAAAPGGIDLTVVDVSPCRNVAAVRNALASKAGGDLLLFCDADDRVAPSWSAALRVAVDDAQRTFAASAVCNLEHGTAPPPPEEVQRRERPPYLGFLPFADTAGMAIGRAALERLGGFHEGFERGSDVELSWRAQLRGLRLVTATSSLVFKYGPPTPTGWADKHDRWGRSHVELYRRFRGSGMPGPEARAVLRRYAALTGHRALAWRDDRHALLAVKGIAMARGRLRRSWELRTWYP